MVSPTTSKEVEERQEVVSDSKDVQGRDPATDEKNASMSPELISAGSQQLHRKLGGKEVQLLAVGGAIGTSLFVQMGAALPKGGPGGLLLGFVLYGSVVLAINQCFAEMVTYLPIPLPFVRQAGFWVDDALSFAMGWNYFFLMAFNIPYEITAIHVLITYWTDKVSVGVVVVICLVIFGLLNGITVKYFGISEFYMSMFKIFLMLGLMFYTFITMVGGNPDHDPYGFRYWRDPGSFVEYLVPGDVGRFCGLLACIIQGSFTMVGPEFISMAAPEAKNPRKLMRRAYSSFVWRLMFFFIGGALCVGIVIPHDDEILEGYINDETSTGAASPYVISMVKFGIKGVPDLVNALIITSVLSAGNNVVFSAARTLHGMSLEGKAPQFFGKCTKWGVPYYALGTALCFCLLSLLGLGNSASTVLDWLVAICTASYIINYFGTAITYLHFHAALRRQGIDRNTLPYKGYLQPYAAWYALFGTLIIALILGYDVFISGNWDTTTFCTNYMMVGFFPVAILFWKVIKRTKYVWPGTADIELGTTKKDIDLYESLYEPPKRGKILGYLNSWFE